MAHVQKSTKAQVGGLTRHYERFKKENGEYIKFNNQEIDITKSHLNYNLATHQNMNQLDFIKKRTSEVNCPNRKEINVMCSWVVTAPKEIEVAEQEKFFQETYKFLEKRYGKENVISAYVHQDETTPHIHFAFVPIKFDEKKEKYKVCAKEVVNRQDLRTFHIDLTKHMENVFKRDIGLINDATKNGNKTVVELKQETYNKKVKYLEKKLSAIKEKMTTAEEIDNIDNNKKRSIGGNIKLSKEQYETLLKQAEKGCFVDESIKTYNELTKKHTALIKEYNKLKKEVPTIQERIKYKKRETELEAYKKHFGALPNNKNFNRNNNFER